MYVCMYVCMYVFMYVCMYVYKGKGIRFIVLYPPKCSHDLPPLAGTVHTAYMYVRNVYTGKYVSMYVYM